MQKLAQNSLIMMNKPNKPIFFNPYDCRNETEVESKFIVQYLLPALGYSPHNWHQEVALGSIRLDFLVFTKQILPYKFTKDSPLALIIEAKSPKHSLNRYTGKMEKYIRSLSVNYGVLTNGKDFRILAPKDKDIAIVFRCSGREVPDRLAEIKSLIGWAEVAQARMTTSSSAQIIDKNKENNVKIVPDLAVTPQPVPEFEPIVATEEKKMKTIAVYHNKGGVGKTTTVVNLGAALSKEGKRVLIIDLDSQANTTFAVGLVKFDDEADDTLKNCHVMHLLSSEDFFPIKQVAKTTNFSTPTVDVIPSHIDLMKAESDLNNIDHSRLVLIKKLLDVENDYDIVIIDTPPSLNLFARIALIAADYLIIPSDLKPFANQGLTNVKNLINEVNGFRKIIGKQPLQLLGVLATKISTNAKFREYTLPDRMQTVMKRYGIELMETIISEKEDLAKCSERTQTILDEKTSYIKEIPDPLSVIDFKPDSDSAKEFKQLAQEVLRKIA